MRLMKWATNQPDWLIKTRQPGSIISPTIQLLVDKIDEIILLKNDVFGIV
jgi:hypothetical protein